MSAGGTDLDVAVVGAGIAGLSLAYRLRRAGLAVRVFEASGRVGGRMASFRHGGFIIDEGAEQVPTYGYQATWALLRELGLPPSQVPRVGGAIGVWRDGGAHAGLADASGLITGAGLSGRGRLDLLRLLLSTGLRRRAFDPDRPEDTPLGAATVGQLAARYHPDLGRYLLTPVVSSFFGWDPGRSAAAPFVSLLLAVGPARTWRTYRDGMDTLARCLADRVDVATRQPVREVSAGGDRARVLTDGGAVTARTAVLCVPAPVALRLYPGVPAGERRFLAECGFTPMLKVSCLLDRPLAPRSARRLYALLLPAAEDPVLGGILIDHAKHPGRVPAGRGLITLLAAPSAIPELLNAPDGEVARRVAGAAERFVPGLAAATVTTFVFRFRHGLPEATPAALALRRGFLRRAAGPVDYAGDWVMLRPSSEGAVRAAGLAAARIRARHGVQPRELA